MNMRYRLLSLAVFALALAGAAPLAQARDRHVDFTIQLPHLAISSHHGYVRHPGHYPPRVVAHYHGGQICHLNHAEHGYYYGHPYYGHLPRQHDRHHYGHRYGH